MTVRVTPGFDATHENIAHLPPHGVKCGYTTGGLLIAWTEEDWLAHPGSVRICQDAGATDHTADLLDIERYAATIDDIGPWCRGALRNFHAVTRPGQRMPALYASAVNIPAVVSRLRADGLVGQGIGLVVADWNLDDAQATKDVEDSSGDFPIVGIQWTDKPVYYDIDVFSVPWLTNMSHVAPVQVGPFLHFTDGTMSLVDIAAARNIEALEIMQYSAQHYTADDISALGEKVLPSGIPYYTHRS